MDKADLSYAVERGKFPPLHEGSGAS